MQIGEPIDPSVFIDYLAKKGNRLSRASPNTEKALGTQTKMIEDVELLKLPAPWIDHPDREWAFVAHMLLGHVVDQVNEASLVFQLFTAAGQSKLLYFPDRQRLQDLYARSFVYSLDSIGQVLRVFLTHNQLSPPSQSECQRFLAQFGSLHKLRNSLQHIEDRLRGLGRGGKPLPNGLVILGCFRNNCFGGTTDSGEYVEIEMSRTVLFQARQVIEDLIWSFAWLGPGDQPVLRRGLGA